MIGMMIAENRQWLSSYIHWWKITISNRITLHHNYKSTQIKPKCFYLHLVIPNVICYAHFYSGFYNVGLNFCRLRAAAHSCGVWVQNYSLSIIGENRLRSMCTVFRSIDRTSPSSATLTLTHLEPLHGGSPSSGPATGSGQACPCPLSL